MGTYAGQIVIAGFMNWKIPLFVRRALTMLPSLVALAIGVNTSRVLVVSQIVLPFGIPFALVPLLLPSRRKGVMPDMVNCSITTVTMAATTTAVTALNIYLLHMTFS